MNQKENAYVSMRKRHQQEFDAFPHFFAFSEAEFSEGMKKLELTPNDRGMISTFLGAGDYYRKTDLPALIEMMARQSRERQQAIAEDKTGEGFILDMFSQELANHEYSYTQDLTAIRHWRRMTDSKEASGGKEYGTAMHTIMQYIRLDKCHTREGIEMEIQRIVECGLLTKEQAERANIRAIEAFFNSRVGKKFLSGETIREFKFSILNDAYNDGQHLDGEKVLLQGVVDCTLIEDDGITVVDFKTDFVTKETLQKVVAKYRPQVKTYESALERIYEAPV